VSGASSSRPVARSGLLIATLAGVGIGALLGRALESATGGADPEFVAMLGAAFGGVLGRSVWTRVNQARRTGRSILTPLSVLSARITLCVAIGVALIGHSPSSSTDMAPLLRMTVIVVSMGLFAVLAVVEYRWLRQPGRAEDGGRHVD
jgi:hypothetical protein